MTAARTVKIGRYTIGGGNPVRVQTMCNTDTRDVSATVRQILLLERAGCEINRVAVPDMSTAKNLGKIKKRINSPLVADIHFDHRLALEAVKQGVDKIRINPGNIGSKEKVREVAKACADRKIPIRIGVNAGSLKEHKIFRNAKECARAMVRAALEEVSALEDMGFRDIVVSLKADDIERTVLACRMFAQKSDIPLHLGITEAGSFLPGVVKSAIGLGALLADGIGATIRVSLTEDPLLQVRCAYEILKALGLRKYGPNIISCPTCGRCRVDIAGAVRELEQKIYSDPKLLRMSEGKKIAVMGCAVNGPGEARSADFGIAGAGKDGVWFEKGKAVKKIPQNKWVSAIINRIKGEHL